MSRSISKKGLGLIGQVTQEDIVIVSNHSYGKRHVMKRVCKGKGFIMNDVQVHCLG